MYKPFQVTTSTILKEFSLNNQSSITYQLISLRFFYLLDTYQLHSNDIRDMFFKKRV